MEGTEKVLLEALPRLGRWLRELSLRSRRERRRWACCGGAGGPAGAGPALAGEVQMGLAAGTGRGEILGGLFFLVNPTLLGVPLWRGSPRRSRGPDGGRRHGDGAAGPGRCCGGCGHWSGAPRGGAVERLPELGRPDWQALWRFWHRAGFGGEAAERSQLQHGAGAGPCAHIPDAVPGWRRRTWCLSCWGARYCGGGGRLAAAWRRTPSPGRRWRWRSAWRVRCGWVAAASVLVCAGESVVQMVLFPVLHTASFTVSFPFFKTVLLAAVLACCASTSAGPKAVSDDNGTII